MNTILTVTKNVGRVALLACAVAGLLPTPAAAANTEVVAVEILADDVYVATAKTRMHEPITIQFDDGQILAIYPEHVGLRGDSVTLAIYEVDNAREVGSRNWLESVEVTPAGSVALDPAKVKRPLVLRLAGVELSDR